jgi:hypothetical protein
MQTEKNSGVDFVPLEKRPYSSPLLVRYGAVRELTQAGSHSPSENASAGCNKVTNALNKNC